MNLNEMVVFAKVVQAGSFRAAGRELEMPRSTVSRRVSDLEERLGARLLQRTTRKLRLTDVGAAYYRRCARIVTEVEEADLEVMESQATPRGVLRVSAPLSFGVLGPTVTEFLRRYPEVRVEIAFTDRMVDLVEEGVDVAIRVGRLADSTLVSRNLGKGATMVVASPEYLEGRGVPESPADLKDHDCLVFGGGPSRKRWELHAGRVKEEVRVTPRIVANDFGVIHEAALGGLGIAMMPTQICVEHIKAARLQHLLKDWRPPEVPLQAVYPSTRHPSPKVHAFLDLLRERLSPEVWGL